MRLKQKAFSNTVGILPIQYTLIFYLADLLYWRESYMEMNCWFHLQIHSYTHLSNVSCIALMLNLPQSDEFLCLNQFGIFINYEYELIINSWYLVLKAIWLQFPVSSVAVLQPLFHSRAHTSPTRLPSPPLWTTCLVCHHLMDSPPPPSLSLPIVEEILIC